VRIAKLVVVKTQQLVEKVVVGPVGGPKTGLNTTETSSKIPIDGVLSFWTRVRKGHEGAFQHAGKLRDSESTTKSNTSTPRSRYLRATREK
jgi:hypothetical protein